LCAAITHPSLAFGALALTWIDDQGTAQVAGQVDNINGVDHNFF
jgi:hypothetical protein